MSRNLVVRNKSFLSLLLPRKDDESVKIVGTLNPIRFGIHSHPTVIVRLLSLPSSNQCLNFDWMFEMEGDKKGLFSLLNAYLVPVQLTPIQLLFFGLLLQGGLSYNVHHSTRLKWFIDEWNWTRQNRGRLWAAFFDYLLPSKNYLFNAIYHEFLNVSSNGPNMFQLELGSGCTCSHLTVDYFAGR